MALKAIRSGCSLVTKSLTGSQEDLLASSTVDVSTFFQRDLTVVACARCSRADFHFASWKLVDHGLVNAGLHSYAASLTPDRTSSRVRDDVTRCAVIVPLVAAFALLVGVRVEVSLGLLGDLQGILTFVCSGHGFCSREIDCEVVMEFAQGVSWVDLC